MVSAFLYDFLLLHEAGGPIPPGPVFCQPAASAAASVMLHGNSTIGATCGAVQGVGNDVAGAESLGHSATRSSGLTHHSGPGGPYDAMFAATDGAPSGQVFPGPKLA